ncbi:hypothetical protein CK203_066448 [Vitis vinifera]|uniref:Integrase catalytic domain-containing protein n=1 Tax=Vitis vinifera TaxID=29760 RepID=A0A438GBE6_VITVI|nr:hypothetical protein CK203_066448 [Vitis vinifera]
MPRYPQNNGQAKVMNKTLLNSLNKWLEGVKGKWVNELPGVLWAYQTTQTTSRRLIGVTLFALAFGMEVIILIDIGVPTLIMAAHETKNNSARMEMHLEWADENREAKTIHMASYQ